MSDNLPALDRSHAPLAGHALIVLQGPDATVFAQAQFANDVAALAPGHWQWNTWLTPKGRVIAVFALLKLAEDEIRLVLLDAPAEDFCAQLGRFVLRRKVRIAVAQDIAIRGAFAAPAIARGNALGLDAHGIELDYGGDGAARTLRMLPADPAAVGACALAAADPSAPQASEADGRWFECDLRHGLPRLPPSQRQQWTPQQLSLERLRAFSVKKGCYPGQEIVARTHFLGKAKRGLALLETPSAVAAGAEVLQSGRGLGEVVSAGQGRPGLALAVLPLERDHAAPLEIRAPVEAPPLPGSPGSATPVEIPALPGLPARCLDLSGGLAR